MAEAPVRPGEIVSGRYRVDRVIGAGSMGFVVSAWHLELDQAVALKLLNPDVFERDEALQRFRREVRATARIKSEHVSRVIDVGALENGVPFMVMELLQGNNLEEELDRRGALPATEAVAYMLEAVEALAEAHAAGIIHRDLKPANLFVARRADRSRLVKVLDFGISKSLVDSKLSGDMSLTGAGEIIGSPLYMSPEQMRSTKDADYRSDIWSLGAILYQLLTGRPPYTGDNIAEICSKHYADTLLPPSKFAQRLPPGLDAVVLRALAREPADRYQTVAEFGAALADFAPLSRVHAERAQRVLMAAKGPPPSSDWPRVHSSVAPTIEASVSSLSPFRQSLRGTLVRWLFAAAVIFTLVGLGFIGARRSQRAVSAARAPASGAAQNPARTEPEAAAPDVELTPPAPSAVARAPSASASALPSESPGASASAAAPALGTSAKRRRSVVSEPAGNVSDFGGRH